MTIADEQQRRSAAFSGNSKGTTLRTTRPNSEARRNYNLAEKKARYYSNKLRKKLSDGSLSSKKWWNTVNTLSGKSTRTDIPVLKDQHHVYTTAKEKAQKFCQTFAAKCQLDR